jgi:SDR family mycofactocin-dependent oxidoreductase
MGILDGQVALITGGARGQGRAHAQLLATAGADIVLIDSMKDNATTKYPMATLDDLGETEKLVTAEGRRCLTYQADVRDLDALCRVADEVVATWGRIDVLIANAGILTVGEIAQMSAETWDEMIDINLTGVFKTLRAVIPHMKEAGYGRVVATASVAGRMGTENLGHYTAAKWGVIGLVKSAALETMNYGITVNAVTPPMVATTMVLNDDLYSLFLPDIDNPTEAQIREAFAIAPMKTVPWIEPSDVSRSILFLVSPESRYITGETLGPTLGFAAQHGA